MPDSVAHHLFGAHNHLLAVPRLFAAYHLRDFSLLDRHVLNRQAQGRPSLLDKDTIEKLAVKVDNACRTAVLDENGELRAGTTEMMEKKNEVKIGILSESSQKNSPKAYGSMVVYVTKRPDAARLLEGK